MNKMQGGVINVDMVSNTLDTNGVLVRAVELMIFYTIRCAYVN